ncbi:MAG: hypothetical protein WDM96_05735 [Lacunisphaera sp.]
MKIRRPSRTYASRAATTASPSVSSPSLTTSRTRAPGGLSWKKTAARSITPASDEPPLPTHSGESPWFTTRSDTVSKVRGSHEGRLAAEEKQSGPVPRHRRQQAVNSLLGDAETIRRNIVHQHAGRTVERDQYVDSLSDGGLWSQTAERPRQGHGQQRHHCQEHQEPLPVRGLRVGRKRIVQPPAGAKRLQSTSDFPPRAQPKACP